jgi:hypothetical protein
MRSPLLLRFGISSNQPNPLLTMKSQPPKLGHLTLEELAERLPSIKGERGLYEATIQELCTRLEVFPNDAKRCPDALVHDLQALWEQFEAVYPGQESMPPKLYDAFSGAVERISL